MSEQLNERERYFVEAAFPFTGGLTFGAEERIRRAFAAAPPDPRDAELSALRAEVDLLNGLLDEIEYVCDVDPSRGWDIFQKMEGIRDILSRRTAERKEPTDAGD